MTFRARLLAGFGLLIAGALALASVVTSSALTADLQLELDQRLERQARGAVPWVSDARHHARVAERIAELIGTRVAIYDDTGGVIGESPPAPQGEPRDTPELAAARRGQVGHDSRRNPETGVLEHHVAVPADGGLVLRLTLEETHIESAVATMRRRLLLGAALALAVTVVLGHMLARTVARPVQAMTAAAAQMASGSFDVALPPAGSTELATLSQALGSLARQLSANIAALTAERDRLSALLAGMTDGVLAVDAGVVALANPAAEALLGMGPLIGRALNDVVHDRAVLAAATETGAARQLLLEDQGRRLLVSVQPVPPSALVLVLHDLTAIQRLETLRRDFVANASHELRTPVAAIQGFAETLLRGAVDATTTREFLEIIHRHAQRIGGIVNDLMRLAEVEHRDSASPRQSVALEPLASTVVRSLGERAARREIALAVEVAGDVNVLGDPAGVELILENLVENAVKYGRDGGSVHVRASRAAARVRLEVSDDGPGIEQEHLPRIFERFYRGAARAVPGAGLGLAIVKHLAEAMGGSVGVDSEVGRGCRFFVDLAAAPDSPEGSAA